MANSTAPPNSSKPTTAQVVGGAYNATPETLQDGQVTSLQFDVNGNLKTTSSGGGGGDVNIADVAGNPPALSNPLPVELSDGTNALGVSGNPLYVQGAISATNPSVGTTNTPAPASATEIGVIDSGGKLQGVSSTNPLPVSVTAIVADSVNQGNPNTPANAWPVEMTDGTNVLGTPTYPVRTDPTGTTTQPVSGTLTVQQTTGTNLHVVVDSAPTTAVTLPAGQAVELLDGGGVNKATISVAGAVKVDGSAVTQPVSIASGGDVQYAEGVVVPVPTGTAAMGQTPTSAVQVLNLSQNGSLLTQDGTPGDNTVLKEVLMELRAMRKLLFMLYEETGQGAPTGLLDDVDVPQSVDYTK
jgi:hypothetical protein